MKRHNNGHCTEVHRVVGKMEFLSDQSIVIPAVSEPAGSDGHRASRVSSGSTVNQSVRINSPQDSGVNDVWPVGGSNDENVLLAAHPVHLSQDLVDDSV